MVVAKLDRLSRDVAFISGLMAHSVPFVLGALLVIILFFALSVFLIATLVVGVLVAALILSSVLRSYLRRL